MTNQSKQSSRRSTMFTLEPCNETGKLIAKIIKKVPLVMEKPEDFQKVFLLWTFFYSYVFETWKTVKIKDFENVEEIFKELKRIGIKTNISEAIIKKIPIAKSEDGFNMILFSLEDLGFDKDGDQIDGVEYKDICQRAKQIGLKLCPLEIVPHLRLQYDDQPKGEWIAVPTEPNIGNNYPVLFILNHDNNGVWLRHYEHRSSDDLWNNLKFAFILQRMVE